MSIQNRFSKFFIQASTTIIKRHSFTQTNICLQKDNTIKYSQQVPQRYKTFDDEDADIIYDNMDAILNVKQPKKKTKIDALKLVRGKTGVFDLEEIINLLKEENFKDIITIKVPKKIKYCDYMIICTSISNKQLKSFVELLDQIYKLKKNVQDPYLNLSDKSENWRLIDLKNIIIHIFDEKTRQFYDLETLWLIGKEFDDKVQKPEISIVKNILDKHIDNSVDNFIQRVAIIWIYFSNGIFVENNSPNFLIMIADDMGYGDVSRLGNTTVTTTNIDRIANNGITLQQHLTSASVCTPSRSAFLTGRYPIRNGIWENTFFIFFIVTIYLISFYKFKGMTSPYRNRVFLMVASSGGLPQTEITIAKSLKKLNYFTGFVGKWHLGKDCVKLDDNCHHPNNHGFDYFFGLPLTNLKDFGDDGNSVVLSMYPHFYLILSSVCLFGVIIGLLIFFKFNSICLSIFIIWWSILIPGIIFLFQKNITTLDSMLYLNDKLVEQPIKLKGITDRFTLKAETLIRNAVAKNVPFFIVLSFVKLHTALVPTDEFKGKSKHGKYGDCLLEMDKAVGAMIDLLEELNIANNTFTYFSSDNGAHLEEVSRHGEPEGGSNGIYRGGKGHGAMEGGIRVPTFVMWPSVLPVNRTINVPTSQMDIFTTIHNIVNLSLPNDRLIDGKNILPLLKGHVQNSPHDFMFHYCGTYLHGVRFNENLKNVWKIYFYTPNYKPREDKCSFVCFCFGKYVVEHNPPLIYNIAADPREIRPLSVNNTNYKVILKKVMDAVENHRTTINDNVESQFSFVNSIWKPWLQPCCGHFPSCSC